jgi:hypothetical protein
VDHAAAAAPWINKPNNVFIYSAAAEAVDFQDEENDIKSCAANRLLIGTFCPYSSLIRRSIGNRRRERNKARTPNQRRS